jgi:PAS domain-containing protein
MGTSGLDRTLLELRAFIDGIPALAWSALPDGFTEFFNQRFSDYSGLSPDQVCAQGSRHFTATTRKSSSNGGTGSRSPGRLGRWKFVCAAPTANCRSKWLRAPIRAVQRARRIAGDVLRSSSGLLKVLANPRWWS